MFFQACFYFFNLRLEGDLGYSIDYKKQFLGNYSKFAMGRILKKNIIIFFRVVFFNIFQLGLESVLGYCIDYKKNVRKV